MHLNMCPWYPTMLMSLMNRLRHLPRAGVSTLVVLALAQTTLLLIIAGGGNDPSGEASEPAGARIAARMASNSANSLGAADTEVTSALAAARRREISDLEVKSAALEARVEAVSDQTAVSDQKKQKTAVP